MFDAKRMIGREWTDKAVQADIKFYPFKVIEKQTKPHIKVDTGSQGEKTFAPEEISAMVPTKTGCLFYILYFIHYLFSVRLFYKI